MWTMIIYMLVGYLLGFAFRLEDDRCANEDRLMLFIMVFLWPVVLLITIPRICRFKYKGKIIWERKR